MRRVILFQLILAAIVLSSCSKEENLASAGKFECSIRASLPEFVTDSDITRGSLSYVVRLNWQYGDKISVINATTGKALGGSLTADATSAVSTFSGSLTGTINSGDKLVFIYPGQDYTEEQDFEGIDFDFSSQSGKSAESVPFVVSSSCTATGSTITNLSLGFSYCITFLQVTLADLPASTAIEYFKVSGVSDLLSVDLEDQSVSLTSKSSGSGITLNPGNKTMSNGARTLFMALPPQGALSGRKATTCVSGTDYTVSFTSSALSAGTAYRLPLTTFGGYDDGSESTDPGTDTGGSNGGNPVETNPGGDFGE